MPVADALESRPLTPAERQARRRERAGDEVRQQQRDYYQRHRDRLIAEQVERGKAEPVKHRARQAVNRAIHAGTIRRGPCAQADAACAGPIQAHHPDYEKPLEVEWLCQRHHGREHRPESLAA